MTYHDHALFLLSCFGFLLRNIFLMYQYLISPANLAAIQIVLSMNVFQKTLHLITSAELILLSLETCPLECPRYLPRNSKRPTREKSN